MIYLLHLQNPWDPYLWNLHGVYRPADSQTNCPSFDFSEELHYWLLGIGTALGTELVEGKPRVGWPLDFEQSGIDCRRGRIALRDSAKVFTSKSHGEKPWLTRACEGYFGEVLPMVSGLKRAIDQGELIPLLIPNTGRQSRLALDGGQRVAARVLQSIALEVNFPGLLPAHSPVQIAKMLPGEIATA